MSAVEARNGRVDVEVPADEDAKQCARLLKDPHANLKSIDLRRGLVTSAGAGAIAKALKGARVQREKNTLCLAGQILGGQATSVSISPSYFGGSVRKVQRIRRLEGCLRYGGIDERFSEMYVC